MSTEPYRRDEASPLVSVVVPVYNIETLVEACVQSILGQSYAHLEIILVDDGSTDRSGSICEAIAQTDDRVRVLTKVNGGLSDARNHGIRHAVGALITCVDGDDMIARDYVAALMRPLIETDADLSSIGFLRVLEGYVDARTDTPDATYEFWPREVALERLFLQDGLTTSAWGKMYRSNAFDGIEYPVGSIHEDLPVTYKLVSRARAVAGINSVGYFYVQRRGSITGRADYGRRVEAVRFAEEAVEFCRLEEPNLVGAAKARAMMECAYIISQVPRLADLRDLDPVVPGTIRSYRGDVLRYRRTPKAQKLTALISFAGIGAVWSLMRVRSIASSARTTMRSTR